MRSQNNIGISYEGIKAMRRILFWLLVFIGVTVVFRDCNDGGKLLLLRVGCRHGGW